MAARATRRSLTEANLKASTSSTSSATRPRSNSVASSSSLSSLSSSDLSELSDDEASRPRKKARTNNGLPPRPPARPRSPSVSEDSDHESADENDFGNARPGKKLYLKAGLYSNFFKQDATVETVDATDKTVDAAHDAPADEGKSEVSEMQLDAPDSVLQAVPLAVPAVAQQAEKRGGKRASSIAASLHFSRNGAGPLPQRPTVHKSLPKPKARKRDDASKQVKMPLEKTSDDPILPLPINYGEYVIDEQRDFYLPFDIKRDFAEYGPKRIEMLRRQGKHQVPHRFTHIRSNVYVERNKTPTELPAICQCPKGSTCGDSCVNRMMLYLCAPKLCPAGPSCTNIPFNNRSPLTDADGYEATQVFWTGNRGFGLRTLIDIPAETFIMEYRGEVCDFSLVVVNALLILPRSSSSQIISRDESYRRVSREYKDRHDFYFLDYDGEEVIDAGMRGNDARFCNHSCDPNCKVVRFRLADLDEWQVALFSKKPIKAKEELTYDYGWVTFASLAEDGDKKTEEERRKGMQRCHCGAKNCSGFLGGKKKNSRR